MEKGNAAEQNEKQKTLNQKQKYILTAVAYLSYMTLGIGVSINGSCLIDLAAVTQSTVGEISWIFTGASAGGIIGAILVPLVARRCIIWVPVGIALLMNGIIYLILPWFKIPALMIGTMVGFGIGKSFIDGALTYAIVDTWKLKNGPWILAHNCVYGIGSMLAPIIAKPFLSPHEDNIFSINGSMKSQPLTLNLSVENETNADITKTTRKLDMGDHNVSTISPLSIYNPNIQSKSLPNAVNMDDGSGIGNKTTQIPGPVLYQAYLIVSGLFFISALTAIMIGLTYQYVWRFQTKKKRNKKSSLPKTENLTPTLYKNLLIGSLFAFTFSYMLIEHATFMFLYTFAVKETKWSKDSAILLVFVYLLSYTLTRGLWAFFARCIKPQYTLFMFTMLTLTCSVVLWIWYKSHSAILWTCGIGIGVGIAPLFGAVVTYFNVFYPLTPLVGGLTQLASASSGVVVPSTLGFLYIYFGPVLFVYIIFIASVLVMICFFSMTAFGRVIAKLKTNQLCTETLT